MNRNKLDSGKQNIDEQFNEGDLASSWLEGWICGYTDPIHANLDDERIREELINYLDVLREM